MKQTMKLFLLLWATILCPFTTLSAQTVWDGSVAESFAGGTGTQDDPYLISSGEELAYLAKIVKENGSQTSGKYYKLTADIVLNDDVLDDNLKLKTGNIASFKEWIPIGYGNNSNGASDPYSFMGYFDGAGHVISGVYVVNHGNRYAGLFGVCDGGEIHNLAVVDSYIDATDAFGAAVIAGHLLGYSGYTSGMKVYQCFAEGYVSGGTNAGLIVGHNGGENALISESYCYGRILSAASIGSVAGYCDRASIRNCYSVALTGVNGTASVYSGGATNIYYDSTVNSQGNYATGKTTEELKSEEFAQLLGAPFVYAEGKYPYIDGLPVLGERTSVLSGLRLRVGELTNGHGSTVKFYREYDGTDVSKSAIRAEAGDTVYVKVTPYKRMLITGGAPVVTNDVTGAAVKLTALPNSTWSFIMPESNVTVTAKFYKDPKAPIAWDGSVAESFAGGTGTQDDPYLISNAEELAYLSKFTKENPGKTTGKYYQLTDNILLNENVLNENYQLDGTPENIWVPIGDPECTSTYNPGNNDFQGIFDGAGHVISGMYCPSEYEMAGLFGNLSGQVHNLAVVDSYVTGGRFVGLIVGGMQVNCNVSRCYAAGYAKSNRNSDSYVGLITGHLYNNCVLEHCYSTGCVNVGYATGGLTGWIDYHSSTVRNCFTVADAGNGAIGGGGGTSQNNYFDNTIGNVNGNGIGKSTEEMQSESFAQLLGEPFVYAEGNYPYIEGLPMVGEEVEFATSGFRLNCGTLVNGKGSSIKYYREFDGTDVDNSARRAEVGDTVYLKVTPRKYMLLRESSLVVMNDETGQTLALTSVAENIWSFTMPESSVTVTATFYRDSKAPDVWDGTVATGFAGGTGTEEDPYLIENGAQLAYMGQLVRENGSQYKGVYFKLISNIVLNEDVLTAGLKLNEKNVSEFNKWLPIGQYNNTSDNLSGFNAYFDGSGYCISGVYCPDGYYHSGLFAFIRSGAVHDLALLDSYVKGSTYVGGLSGAYCAYNSDEKAEIYNCYIEACVEASSYGGIALGHLGGGNSYIRNCYTYGRVLSGSYTGSIAGYTDRGHSENCYSVCLEGVNGTSYIASGSASKLYYDSTVNSSGRSATGKTTEEMQSALFAQLLGEPFVYAEGNYPYIEGLPMIGEDVDLSTAGFRLNRDAFVNGKGSSIKFSRDFNGTDVGRPVSRAEAGETVYVKVSPHKRMLLTDGSLKLVNDETGKTVMLTSVGENIWSFTMPEYSVSITAAFHRNPDLPLVWMGDVADSFAGGSGTQDDPYQISNGDELAYLAKLTMANGVKTKGVYYKLTADIILNEDVLTEGHQLNEAGVNDFCKWAPIGHYISDSDLSQTFQGYFDGNGYSISGIYCPDNEFAAGLFGHIYNGNVHDLSVLDTYVKASNLGGGIAGYLQSTSETETARIYNCYAEACVVGGYSMGLAVGHVAGSYSSVDHCYTYGCASGSYPAGIVGYLSAGRVEKCYSVCKSGYNGVYNNYSTVNELYFDSTVNSYGRNATGKTTNEMQSEAFVDMLGEPFEYVDGNYPYIDGLRQIGQGYTDKATGYRTNVGAMSNANGCTIKFFAMDGDILKMVRRVEAGEKVYLRPILTHHMLMAESDLVLTNDATGKDIALKKEGANIYSFTMPEADVTVKARFYINPKQAMAWDGTVADSFAGGTGTQEDPYLISNGAELAYLAKITNADANATKGQYYRLTNDIVLNADVLDSDYQLIGTPKNQWTPIGTTSNYRFYGDFDGANHVISGLYAVGGRELGLFGLSAGCIHDLAVVDAYLYNPSYSVGIICGSGLRSDSISISRCYAEGSVYGYYTGLLLGGDNGRSTVEYCYGTGVVNTGYTAGGLVGDMYADMNHCYVVTKVDPNRGHGLVKITHSNTFVHLYYDRSLSPSVPVGISDNATCAGKSTGEMISQSFADMLGEPFAYSFGDYPYIPGLPKIGEPVEFASAGYHVNIGTLVNTCGSSVEYYSEFDGKKVRKATRSANTGETVYLKVDLGRRMLLIDGTLKVVNDITGQVLTLTNVAEGIWSFTMPDFSVTVSASFHRDPNLPDVWEGDIAAEFAEGEGTEDDPYLIHDGTELAYLAQLCNANAALTQGKYYKLVNDIFLNEDVLTDEYTLNGKPRNAWTPIGKDDSHKFQGVFDGDNHYITGVYVPSGSYSGLFGYVDGAVIRNLSLLDTYVYGGHACGLVYNAASTEEVLISRCYSEAYAQSMYSNYYATPLVGILGEKGTMEYCYSSGLIGGSTTPKAGIAISCQGTVRNCFSAVKNAPAFYTAAATSVRENCYSDEDLGGRFVEGDSLCSRHTIDMYTTDFAERLGEPFEYVLGNYPYIPGLKKIDENRDWKTPDDPTHSDEEGIWDGATSVIFASGKGTEADPYIINNAAQLSYLAKLTNANGALTKGKYYKLDADILLNDTVLTNTFELKAVPANEWEPIGQDNSHMFQGVFDGNNHYISGVYIASGASRGLFGFVDGATIRNLSLIDTYIKAQQACGLIYNAASTGEVLISHCYAEAYAQSIYSNHFATPMVGELGEKGVMEYCYSRGLIGGNTTSKAGLIISCKGTVRNCFSTVKNAPAFYNAAATSVRENCYSDEDLGGRFVVGDSLCSRHTIDMYTTDFAERLGEPFEYVLGNYPYIPGLLKISENRGWKEPEDPTHGGAGGVWDGTTSVIFASGTGTESDPYIINNGAQLSYLAKLTNANGALTKDKYYKLDADIVLNDSVLTNTLELKAVPANEWEPIGQDNSHKFQGVFDGNNHYISGVYINSGASRGLFGFVDEATIRNLSLIDTYIKAQQACGLIYNAASTGEVLISHCYAEAYAQSIYANHFATPLVGELGEKGVMEYCYSRGLIGGNTTSKAGLVISCKGTIRNCFSTVKNAPAFNSAAATSVRENCYSDEDLGGRFVVGDSLCSRHTIDMYTTDFAERIGKPFEYVLGNYPYIPGLLKIGENRGWKEPEDPTHGGAGGVWDGTTSVIFASGTGTEADPYIINNGAQLSYLAKLTNANGALTKGKYYRLEADITLNNRIVSDNFEVKETPKNAWEPIGQDTNHKFQGVFDGNNYTISGLYVASDINNGALFGYAENVKLHNLSLVDTYITSSRGSALVNIVSATDTSIVNYCYVDAYVKNNYCTGMINTLGAKCELSNSYITGQLEGKYNTAGLVYLTELGSTVHDCYSAMKNIGAIGNPKGNVLNVYFDSNRAGSTSNVRDDFRSAETPEMLSTDFAARMGEPFEYAVGYYPYIYGLHKIDENGNTSIVNGYPLQMGKLENGGGCTIEFYRGYKKKTKELSLPVAPGTKVFVDNATTIYAKVTPSVIKRLSDDGLIVKTKEAGNQLTITEVDYDLYSFQITDDAVTVSAAFLDGNFCGDPEVNNGRNVRWQLNSAMTGLTIEGTGRMVGGLWSAFADSVRTIGIGEGVTNVPAQAFKGMSKATTLTLPATLETIGTEAFSGCKATVNLQACTLLTALHANEFAQFSGTVWLPATVTAIEADAFSGTYNKVAHVYSPVAAGTALYANSSQVPDNDGWGDIVTFGIKANEAVGLQWFSGFNVNTTANADGVMACYADEALSKKIPNGMKALRADDQTPVYIKVTPSDTKILFRDGLTVKGQSGKVAVTQVSDEVFSFMMPAEAVTISANYATGGYCGTSNVNNGHNLIWTLNNGTLAFQKNGFAQGADITMGGNAPWRTLGSSVKKVDLDGVTNVGDNAFASCTNLVGLELPASPVVTVGANAFAKQMVLIIPAESWNSYQDAGWSAYEEQTTRDKETFSMKDGQQWRTYYSKVGRTLPDGLKAYTIAGVGDAEVTTSEALDYIPAGQAVLIENRDKTACTAEAETSLLPYAQQNVPVCLLTTDEDNLLQWITEPMAVSAGDGYTLYKDEFVKVSTGTLPAGVAFLPAQGVAASRLFIFNGEDEETAIDRVQEAEDNAQWYTLDGKKLSGKPSARGIYLRDGQKVMVK